MRILCHAPMYIHTYCPILSILVPGYKSGAYATYPENGSIMILNWTRRDLRKEGIFFLPPSQNYFVDSLRLQPPFSECLGAHFHHQIITGFDTVTSVLLKP
jgi:hypothetical protein